MRDVILESWPKRPKAILKKNKRHVRIHSSENTQDSFKSFSVWGVKVKVTDLQEHFYGNHLISAANTTPFHAHHMMEEKIDVQSSLIHMMMIIDAGMTRWMKGT